jgi:uncharacterized protein YndB with AHSA1/START domain
MDSQTQLQERELRMTRRIPAPPEIVFAAWTQPDQLKAWFGPNGMTVPEAEVDLRPGGVHRTVMRDAAGKEYPNRLAILEVEAPRRLVLRVVDDACGPLIGSVGTLLFLPDAGGTRFEAIWRHPTPEMRAVHLAMGFEKGWGETLDKLTAHAIGMANPAPEGCPMGGAPSPQHGWLHRMLGEWTMTSECSMGPDQPPMTGEGTERVTSLGGYWVVGEGEGTMPGGFPARWTITMGHDAATGRFRGTWVGSMMPHMFLYDGTLSEDGRTIALESEGPAFDGKGMARYVDSVTLVDDDHRIMTSEVVNPDGSRTRFMTAHFRRKG